MADSWQTFQFEFRGGLVSNLPPLQHGAIAPGSARVLRNFEPSVDGGYRRIEGYEKYSSTIVPEFGEPVVHGGSQTGTSLIVANLSFEPVTGDTFTVAGVAGTYTISATGVSYDSATKRATLFLTGSLATSPADGAAVTFTSNAGLITGLAAWQNSVLACRNNSIYKSTGTTWTYISKPDYGTVLVNGGSQTGGTLAVDGLTGTPQPGDTFRIAGVDLVYTVSTAPTVTSGGATITITPNLASSPADNAAITFIGAGRPSTGKHRFAKYNLNGEERIMGVDGTNYPFYWNDSSFVNLTTAPSDVVGSSHVCWFKNQMFFSKGNVLNFTSPYTDHDFNPANGAGNISVGSRITGLIVFREQLIIFSEEKIDRLVGNTLADFVLQPITRNIGCIDTDTIQEVGSDVMFLGPDGLRLLSATDRIGDFNLAVVSKSIQSETTNVTASSTSFASVIIRQKSQYRLLGYNTSISPTNSAGLIGAQLEQDGGLVFNWAELRGIKAYVANDDYTAKVEIAVFANDTGYVYKMESGNTFDGENITATFSTPYVPINDPRLRKTFYKLFLYTDPEGSIDVTTTPKFDFDNFGTIQPNPIVISNSTTAVFFYGSTRATYGSARYASKLKTLFESQLIGSGFTIALQFVSESSDPPFSLDAAMIEFATFDRR